MDSEWLIEDITTRILDVPLIRPHRFATMTATHQPILLVETRLAGGAAGWGEGVVPGGPWWGGESVETMQVIVERYLTPILRGTDVRELPSTMEKCGGVVAASPFAKAAVEIACHDAWARALEVPLHDLLGGRFRDRIDVTWALGVATVGEMEDEIATRRTTHGTGSFKLKMGAGDPAADTARIVELAGILGGEVGLRVDVNARWSRLTALRMLPKLVSAGIEVVEQPTPAGDIETLAELRRATGAVIMADESAMTAGDVLRLIRHGAADIIAVKTTKCGGLAEAGRMAAVAMAGGLACHAATSIEGPVGTAASAHWAASSPAVTFGSELFGPQLMSVNYCTAELDYSDGTVEVPTGTGTGLTPDRRTVARLSR
ncbi:muconate/chloromuconate family cycloisomerase [Corynebacterium sp. TAE3-ERU16]|uniref:muconate/chloromuconate family cycloisomerase n=1 Tax=Corynebacterium sp. TAE3-ERU16 TaxID=2849493 RepID=UPI001C443E06|nr:muconate/chloromuconate family cycloisomerase [Corynebacterium sp. TAE3-ERU16]MBV7292942.1 muconate/chloromuconate family cycloisomerase [Corynebacterium sp. TAE3-ERU16]